MTSTSASSSSPSSPSKIPGRMFHSSSSSSGTGGSSDGIELEIGGSTGIGDSTGVSVVSSSFSRLDLLTSRKDCWPSSCTTSKGTTGSPFKTACASASLGLAMRTL